MTEIQTDTDTDDITPGRPVRLEVTPPGSSTLVLGIVIAALAPLLGFLGGSLAGEAPGEMLFEPIYWGLFIGVIIGGIGVLMAIVGGRRLWLHNKKRKLMSETVDAPSEPPYVDPADES